MKRGGVGTRDSPSKDRYAGKRQQQGGRGGRRQKPGSRGEIVLHSLSLFDFGLVLCRCVPRSPGLADDADVHCSNGSSSSISVSPPAGHAAAASRRDGRQDPGTRAHSPDKETRLPSLLQLCTGSTGEVSSPITV